MICRHIPGADQDFLRYFENWIFQKFSVILYNMIIIYSLYHTVLTTRLDKSAKQIILRDIEHKWARDCKNGVSPDSKKN